MPVVVVGPSFIGSCAQELQDPGGENTPQGFSSFLQPWSTWWEMKSQGNGDGPGATATPGHAWEAVTLPLLCCSSLPPHPAQSQVGASIPALPGPFPGSWDCGDGDDVRGTGSTSLLDGCSCNSRSPKPQSPPGPRLQSLSCTSGFIPYLLSGLGSGKVAFNVSNGIGLNE